MAELKDQVATLERDTIERIGSATDAGALEQVRVEVLGKKGSLTRLLKGVASAPASQRSAMGQLLNRLKYAIEDAIEGRERGLRAEKREAELGGRQQDVSLPAHGQPVGHRHPLSVTMEEVCDVFASMGFAFADGPDIEDERHNFEALNMPADHPARDMQDTFFVSDGRLLRTHTSPVQIRIMEAQQPPLLTIAPGAAYRQDDDATHSPMFHQVEGLMVDRGVTLGHLKAVLTTFLHRIFSADVPVRFRPSYFPFTEPSAEVDIGCVLCRGDGSSCRVCKGSGWLEILGCGMVHPAVFEHVGYDPETVSGFAFGLGVERIAMLRYGIDDIRLFYGGDLRFLEQF